MDNKGNPTAAPWWLCLTRSHRSSVGHVVFTLSVGIGRHLAAIRDRMSHAPAHYGAKSDDGVYGGERCYRGRMRGVLAKSHGEAKNIHPWEWGRNDVMMW
jgi:hypothetical protein